MRKRILEINPKANVEIFNPKELSFEEQDLIDNTYSYVVDAVDTVKTKLKVIEKAKKEGVPVISAMGAGNKLSCNFIVSDIEKTEVCPLAKNYQKRAKKEKYRKCKSYLFKRRTNN